MCTAVLLVMGFCYVWMWETLSDEALATDSTESRLFSPHRTESAIELPGLCCSATTGATADRERACRAPGGRRDGRAPTPRGAGVVAVPWDRASVLRVRVPAVTPTFLARTCGHTRGGIRLDGAPGGPEASWQAEAGAAGARSCIAATMVQRVECVASSVAIPVARVEPLPKPTHKTGCAIWRWNTRARNTRHVKHDGVSTWSSRRRTPWLS